MSDMTVNADELIAAYKKSLGEATHQIIVMQVAYDKMKEALEKAQARNREFEAAFGMAATGTQADQEPSPERPRNPQRARQVTGELNGAQKDGDGS